MRGSGIDLNLAVHLPLLISTPCDPKLTYKVLSYFIPGLLWAQEMEVYVVGAFQGTGTLKWEEHWIG